jgi:hypothetical protein
MQAGHWWVADGAWGARGTGLTLYSQAARLHMRIYFALRDHDHDHARTGHELPGLALSHFGGLRGKAICTAPPRDCLEGAAGKGPMGAARQRDRSGVGRFLWCWRPPEAKAN